MTSLISIVLGILILQAATKPSFEVAVIKQNTALQGNSRLLDRPGDRFLATRVMVRRLMAYAYRGRNIEFFGGPAWLDSDLWDIEAKAPAGTALPSPTALPDMNKPDAMALMVQSLLEGRFQLKIHYETRELPIYELTLTRVARKLNCPTIRLRPLCPAQTRRGRSGASRCREAA
jgi:uncharacterized protein (TIGR03435 family)